ncbi:hypothetical protein RYX36_016623, partial [Vicia faba]
KTLITIYKNPSHDLTIIVHRSPFAKEINKGKQWILWKKKRKAMDFYLSSTHSGPVCGQLVSISKENFPNVSMVLFPQEVDTRKETSTSIGLQKSPN